MGRVTFGFAGGLVEEAEGGGVGGGAGTTGDPITVPWLFPETGRAEIRL